MAGKFNLYMFTDGSCAATPTDRRGGWACLLFTQSRHAWLAGVESPSTTSRCELLPILAGLRWIRQNVTGFPGMSVRLVTDSEFVAQTLAGNYRQGKTLGDLWASYTYLAAGLRLSPLWVARNSNPHMEAVDAAAYSIRKFNYESITTIEALQPAAVDLAQFDTGAERDIINKAIEAST